MVQRQPQPAKHQFSVHGIVGDWDGRECGGLVEPPLCQARPYDALVVRLHVMAVSRFTTPSAMSKDTKEVIERHGVSGMYKRPLSFLCVLACTQFISLAKLPFPLTIVL